MTPAGDQWAIENLCSKDYCNPDCASHFIKAFCKEVTTLAIDYHNNMKWADGCPYSIDEALSKAFRDAKLTLFG